MKPSSKLGKGLQKKGNFIKGAIKRPGALTAKVGGKPGQQPGKVAALATQPGKTGQQARFFENVLAKK